MGRPAEIPPRQSSGMTNGAHLMMSRRTVVRQPSGLRTDLTVCTGPASRSDAEKSRRAPDGGMAKNAGVTWERVDAEDGGLRACPSVDRSATPRLLGPNGPGPEGKNRPGPEGKNGPGPEGTNGPGPDGKE
ncbi:hypothetical protein GCM10009828_029500 [Actinoplanes couchii]|uniref:Uncharacterized protein n=1 Tax=Actinoplanes couchii TaxID=403638 RepID=A0ABQ3XC30_9ACTN|nr:hypothetical protein Aco03nite_044860 [Actinoplanes couchii]